MPLTPPPSMLRIVMSSPLSKLGFIFSFLFFFFLYGMCCGRGLCYEGYMDEFFNFKLMEGNGSLEVGDI